MDKKVSILLSCFNGSELVESYIDKLLDSSIIDLCTLIAVNFPFSHKDPVFVEEQLKRYPDLVLINRDENISLYDAWNVAAHIAKTKFISNLNLDDRVDNSYYKYGVKVLNEKKADVFSSAAVMTSSVGFKSNDCRPQSPFSNEVFDDDGLVEYGIEDLVYNKDGRVLKRNPPHCAPIWRKSLHEEFGYFDSKRFDFAADYEFWLRLAANGKKFIFSQKEMTLFYCAPGTASDRLIHKESQKILDTWSIGFPYPSYKETHLGRAHDMLHHCMNLNIIFSNRGYYNHLELLVSVVITAHKDPLLLSETIDSVRSQSYAALECIVVIDFGNEELRKVAEAKGNLDSRLRIVILGQKVERNYARNVGIELATGRWITILDGDDVLPQNSVAERVSCALKNPEDIVFGNMIIWSDGGERNISFKDAYNVKDLKIGWPSHCTILFPRKLILSCKYPSNKKDLVALSSDIAGEDVIFMTSLLKKNPELKYVNCSSFVLKYRRHNSSSYWRRHISIAKVIDIVLGFHGKPDSTDELYQRTMVRRAVDYLVWLGWDTYHNGDQSKFPHNARNDLIELASSAKEQEIKNSVDAFIVEISAIIDGSEEKLSNAVSYLTSHLLCVNGSKVHIEESKGIKTQPKLCEDKKMDYQRLLRWKNRHKGEKCILMCNGPSLNKVNFKNISADKYVFFGLNKIFLGFESLGVVPQYIAAINKKVIEQSSDLYVDLSVTKFLSNRVGAELVPENPYTFYMNTANLPKKHTRFSENIINYVYEGWTVTHAALQIAYYMGFSEVYIVGMDHRFKQHVSGEENVESIIEGDDLDHFHPGYFGNGQKWDFPDLKNSELSYIAARKAFEADGKNIFDCTIGGACEVFEKKDISLLYR